MILYKSGFTNGKRDRSKREIEVKIQELPKRPVPKYSTPKDQQKYIKACENVIRKSLEYKEYIKFLRNNFDMDSCIILSNLKKVNGKKYRIEIHHEPFTLFDIVETVITRRLNEGESINTLNVADEVMELHYSGLIGLIPLTVTMHELVHNGRIFIPLQYIYHKYNEFFKEYEPFMNQNLIDKIETKVSLSLQTEDIVSDSLETTFTYLKVDEFKFPQVPDEWRDILSSPINNSNEESQETS